MSISIRRLFLVPLAAALALMVLADAPAQVKKDKVKDAAKGGAVFEVYADKGGHYRFRLKSGDTILAIAGKGYDTKDDCRKVVDEIKAEAGRARVVEQAADDKAKK